MNNVHLLILLYWYIYFFCSFSFIFKHFKELFSNGLVKLYWSRRQETDLRFAVLSRGDGEQLIGKNYQQFIFMVSQNTGRV